MKDKDNLQTPFTPLIDSEQSNMQIHEEQLKPKSPFVTLPDNIGNMTINDLINSKNTEFIKRDSNISMRSYTESGAVVSVNINYYDTGRRTMTESFVPHKAKKADYLDDILEMKRSGMKQKEIARQLGISESYITQLLKK